MYVTSCTSVTVSLERDSIKWIYGRGLFREQTVFATHRWQLAVIQPSLFQRKLGWETMKRYPKTLPGSFANGTSRKWTGNPHFTSRGNIKILSQLWVRFFIWQGSDAGNTSSVRHRFTNLRIILQSWTAILLQYRVRYETTSWLRLRRVLDDRTKHIQMTYSFSHPRKMTAPEHYWCWSDLPPV